MITGADPALAGAIAAGWEPGSDPARVMWS